MLNEIYELVQTTGKSDKGYLILQELFSFSRSGERLKNPSLIYDVIDLEMNM